MIATNINEMVSGKSTLLLLIVLALGGSVGCKDHHSLEIDPDIYYGVVAHRVVPGRPCETLQPGMLNYHGRAVPSFTPAQIDMLGRGPVLDAKNLGGYLVIPGGDNEYQNRDLFYKELSWVFKPEFGSYKVEHPERGKELLADARSAGYDLRFTYPKNRTEARIFEDSYAALPGHTLDECSGLATASPEAIVSTRNHVDTINTLVLGPSVFEMTQVPDVSGTCYIAREVTLAYDYGKLSLSTKDMSNNYLQMAYERFQPIYDGQGGRIDLSQVDPTTVHLLASKADRDSQDWNRLREDALIALFREKGVRIEPLDGSTYRSSEVGNTGAWMIELKDSAPNVKCRAKLNKDFDLGYQRRADALYNKQ